MLFYLVLYNIIAKIAAKIINLKFNLVSANIQSAANISGEIDRYTLVLRILQVVEAVTILMIVSGVVAFVWSCVKKLIAR